jgi:DNA-binding XRE family transcriptional regulator
MTEPNGFFMVLSGGGRKVCRQVSEKTVPNQSALDQFGDQGAPDQSDHLASSVERRQIGSYLDQDPPTARIAFGLRLRQVRTERGLSQDVLARRTDLHTTAIARFERGAREPRLTTILRLARGLEVPPSALMDELRWPESTGGPGP